jgi:hypothetical protein
VLLLRAEPATELANIKQLLEVASETMNGPAANPEVASG